VGCNFILLHHLLEKTVCVSPMRVHSILVKKNLLAVDVWLYFWVFYSVALVCVSVLILKPCLDYNSFVVIIFEVR
jgi:hypothetical protein